MHPFLLVLGLVLMFTMISLALVVATSGVMARIQGAELEARLRGEANSQQKEIVDGLKKLRGFQGFGIMGYHPFNLDVAEQLLRERDIPEAATQMKAVRVLMWCRRASIAAVIAGMIWMFVSSAGGA